MPGVVRTRVGYAGGRQENPTYHRIGDHAETLQVDFDPSLLSYEDLLKVFWGSHTPAHEPYKRQYMSAIFFHDEHQEDAARRSHEASEELLGRRLYTCIAPCESFTRAEDYHQKYLLGRCREVQAELQGMFSEHDDFVDSPAVTKANGYVNGHGLAADFDNDVELFGLSAKASDLLRRSFGRMR